MTKYLRIKSGEANFQLVERFPKAAKDPNSRLRQARRRWRC